MPGLVSTVVRSLIDGPFELLVSPARRRGLGRYILSRAEGEAITRLGINGEELVVSKAAERLKGKAATIIDVGANRGDWTAHIVPLLAAGSTVYCLEPTPSTFKTLCTNLAALPKTIKIIPINSGLGDQDASTAIYEVEGQPMLNSLYQRQVDTAKWNSEPVPISIRRGEAFFQEMAIDQIDFVKVDVEGHEVSVMLGIEPKLKEQKVGCVQFEYGGAWIDARRYLRDAFEIFGRCGYTLAKIHPEGVRPIPKYVSELETFNHSNYVAMRPDWRDAFPTAG